MDLLRLPADVVFATRKDDNKDMGLMDILRLPFDVVLVTLLIVEFVAGVLGALILFKDFEIFSAMENRSHPERQAAEKVKAEETLVQNEGEQGVPLKDDPEHEEFFKNLDWVLLKLKDDPEYGEFLKSFEWVTVNDEQDDK